jgi:hypothetical protein
MTYMKQTAIIVTTVLAAMLATPAHALDYDCSPLTGACTPRGSQPSAFDQPTVNYPPRVWPRTCPLDGPGAWTCRRDRKDHDDQRRR